MKRKHARSTIKFHPQMIWKDLDDISPNMRHAIVLAEDDTFYQHHGFDYEQIQIAFHRNMEKGNDTFMAEARSPNSSRARFTCVPANRFSEN